MVKPWVQPSPRQWVRTLVKRQDVEVEVYVPNNGLVITIVVKFNGRVVERQFSHSEDHAKDLGTAMLVDYCDKLEQQRFLRW